MKIQEGQYQSTIKLEDLSISEYQNFLNIKKLPYYKFNKGIFTINTEYLDLLDNSYNRKVIDVNFYDDLNDFLFDYQKFIVKIALLKRKFAVFADTGLGKTLILIEYLRKVREKISSTQKMLIVSPLMIIEQTQQEQREFYKYSNIINLHDYGFYKWLDEDNNNIGIVNYDLFRNEINFKSKIGAIVLDESSALKHENSIIRTNIINAAKGIEWKLACTATPAPNDREEYANHALFLDMIRSIQEFFSRYFINRDNKWVLKSHSTEYFYRYLASFSIFLRSPVKYGFEDNLKDLLKPIIEKVDIPLTKEQFNKVSKNNNNNLGLTKFLNPGGIVERGKFSQISKGFIYSDSRTKVERINSNKPDAIVDIIKKYKNERFIIWTQFDEEGEILFNKLKNITSVVHITGKLKEDKRLQYIYDFKNNKLQGIISKPKMLGFGLNFQNCGLMVYSGLSDSMEQFYQSMRRSYRYGSTKQLKVFIPITPLEEVIYSNILRKSQTMEADALYQENLYIQKLAKELKDFADKEIEILSENNEKYDIIETDRYKLINGDNVIELDKLEENSIDFCIFSPPFSSLFTYSSDIADMGNSGSDEEFCMSFKFFATRLLRVLRPGRKVCLHIMQLPILKSETGYSGMKDFRGLIIETMNSCGWETRGEVAIKKNQQQKSIINHAAGLSMGQFRKDSNLVWPCFNDFCIIFSKPGENKVPVKSYENGDLTSDEFINLMSGCWTDIRETDTLNTKIAKSDEDSRHICPLQLEVIRRFIKLYSNPDEVVLDPFSGIGSAGVIAMELNRRYVGIELKKEYFETSADYIEVEEVKKRSRKTLGLLERNK